MSISEYIAKMKALVDEISAAGKPIEEDELVAYIINGLDEEYEAVTLAIVAKNRSVSVAKVHSQLLGFENRNSLRHAAANSATRGGRGGDMSRGGRVRGGYRGRDSAYGRGAPSRARGGPALRGRGGRGRFNGAPNNRPICQVCHRRGHGV
jgi:hypothetical protein